MQTGIMMAQREQVIPSSWILLDTCSSHSVTNSRAMMKNTRTCTAEETLTITTNAGTKTFSMIGQLKRMPLTVYLNEDSLGTILAFRDVAAIPGARITVDTAKELAMTVTLEDDSSMKFEECNTGLYA